MGWYYREGPLEVGPIDEAVLDDRARRGIVRPDTPIRPEGSDDWMPYREVKGSSASGAPAPAERGKPCAECGRPFPTEEMVRFGDSWVCAGCKPTFFQRLREGGAVGGALRFAGFWIRAGALFIDGAILWLFGALVGVVQIALLRNAEEGQVLVIQGLTMLIQLAVAVTYETWFVARYAATPGKMACGLKVVTADGEPVSAARAFGRYFAKILSWIILGIGYLMVAFDEEKRGLHDRICDTRVVRAR